jgi:predicted Zn-dependent peptidase
MRAIEIPHDTWLLDNGLHVVLHRDSTLPQVVVNLWYDVGSRDEVAGRSGFAHLFEHLMFMGTARTPGGAFDELMESSGAWNNAWTSSDATDYFEVGPSGLVDTLLWLEADRMEGLADAMTQEKLDLQRDVVRNERRQTHEDAPYGELWLLLGEAMYPPGHPYAHPVIGSHEDLEAATVADVVEFFREFYVPSNASLVVAGDFDPAHVRASIERTFGAIPRGRRPPHKQPGPVEGPQKGLLELTDKVQIPQTSSFWHSPAAYEPGDAELDFAALVLGDGRASRLYRRLVQGGLAIEADAWQQSQPLGSLFGISAMPTEDHTVEEVETAIEEEVARLASAGPTPEELERARNQVQSDFLHGLESLRSRATILNRYWASQRRSDWIAEDVARYRAVTAEGVRDAVARLTPERRLVARVRPA